ncbi:hypothetical protein CLU79DRAFT_476538 [Phycomyces nitens]|nr:hypothetical protein CLU79DRAFT_476538 [Phycomyces nitens]
MDEPNELPNFNSDILKKVDEWKKYHNDQQRTEMDVCKWEENYLNVDEDTLEILLVAGCLKIERLVELLEWKLSTSSSATYNKGVLRSLNIASDFAVENEERELQAQNKYEDGWNIFFINIYMYQSH